MLIRLLLPLTVILPFSTVAAESAAYGVSQSSYWVFSPAEDGYPQGFVDYTGSLDSSRSTLNEVWYSNKPGAYALLSPRVKNVVSASLIGTHKSDRGVYSFVVVAADTKDIVHTQALIGAGTDTSLSVLYKTPSLDPSVEYQFMLMNDPESDAGYMVVQGVELEFAGSSTTTTTTTTTTPPTTTTRTTPPITPPGPTTLPPSTSPGPNTTSPAPSPNPPSTNPPDQCSASGGTSYTTTTITTTFVTSQPSHVSTWTETDYFTDCGVMNVCATRTHHYQYTRTYSGGVSTATSTIVTAVPVAATAAATACGNTNGGGGGGGGTNNNAWNGSAAGPPVGGAMAAGVALLSTALMLALL